eukprot:gnl/Hemi2/12564_TR4293_c0_g1_i1.p1 gnl/Hemi2/12564_TR4293_c0_g1~~gnl/Hemi2/12564_TR4293_c0_g1_i1.p1  ORF type:complete len:299 (-),score=104.35 gnl/Hemi2/12564_TR4293_c0_g1_i1:246-1142(-)
MNVYPAPSAGVDPSYSGPRIVATQGGVDPAYAVQVGPQGVPQNTAVHLKKGDDSHKHSRRPGRAHASAFAHKKTKDGEPEQEGSNQCMDLFLSFCMFGVNLFKATMASMLVIFVPMICGTGASSHTCSISDTLTGGLSSFNYFALAWNFLTLAVLIVCSVFEYMREVFMIEYLEEDDDIAQNALPDLFANRYPEVRDQLYRHNLNVFITSMVALIMLLSNVGISAGFIIAIQFAGFQSVTGIISAVLLVLYKYVQDMRWCYQGLKEGHALSLSNFDPVAYNTIDPKHKNDDVKGSNSA